MVHILNSRILLRPTNPERSRRFYGEQLGLSVYCEYGTGPERSTVYFLGGGFLELSGRSDAAPFPAVCLRLQIEDVEAAHGELQAKGLHIARPPARAPEGFSEMWVEDPDGISVVLVEANPFRGAP